MSKVSGISFITIYVHDYDEALKFYQDHLGYEIKYPMEDHASWGMVGTTGLYLEGNNEFMPVGPGDTRASVVFSVHSASEFYDSLKKSGVELVQEAPVAMGEQDFWFQFKDPAGNILEVLGGQ